MTGPAFWPELLGNLAFYGLVAAVTGVLLRWQSVKARRAAVRAPFVDGSNVTVITDWRAAR